MESLNVIQVMLSQPAAVATPSAPPPDMSFWGSILNAGIAEQIVMLFLLGFSIISWAIIAYKWKMLRKAYRQSEEFLDSFWASKRLDTIYQRSEDLSDSPVSQVFRAGYIELAKLKKKEKGGEANDTSLGGMESVERSMRRAASSELTSLESLVSFLGTTGATAPFIGLLGTNNPKNLKTRKPENPINPKTRLAITRFIWVNRDIGDQ